MATKIIHKLLLTENFLNKKSVAALMNLLDEWGILLLVFEQIKMTKKKM